MAKRRPEFRLYSYGEYSKWDKNSQEIPKIQNITTEIEAEAGTEFGYVLEIKHAKGETNTTKIAELLTPSHKIKLLKAFIVNK
jgi:hypothetical protein